MGGVPEEEGEAKERGAGAGPGEGPAGQGVRGAVRPRGAGRVGWGGGVGPVRPAGRAGPGGEEAGRAGEARPPRRGEEGAAHLHSNRLPPGPGLRGSAAAPRRETAPGGAGGAGPGPSGRPPVTYLQPRAR